MRRAPRLLPRIAVALLCAGALFLTVHHRSVQSNDGVPNTVSTVSGIATVISLIGLYIVVCWPTFRYPRNTSRRNRMPSAEVRRQLPIRHAMRVWSTAEGYLDQLAMRVAAADINGDMSGIPYLLNDDTDPRVRKFHRHYDEALRRHYDGNKTEAFEFFAAVERAAASYEQIVRRARRSRRVG
jgi:hypothetical protein